MTDPTSQTQGTAQPDEKGVWHGPGKRYNVYVELPIADMEALKKCPPLKTLPPHLTKSDENPKPMLIWFGVPLDRPRLLQYAQTKNITKYKALKPTEVDDSSTVLAAMRNLGDVFGRPEIGLQGVWQRETERGFIALWSNYDEDIPGEAETRKIVSKFIELNGCGDEAAWYLDMRLSV